LPCLLVGWTLGLSNINWLPIVKLEISTGR
jgi:hypothetical protein